MLITISQRVRPVLLTATVTALGVIPMALNIEFDFIGREITVGGLAGTWFVALSEALVSGLFVSTSLTLILVPVMVTAPHVVGLGLRSVFGAIRRGVGGLFFDYVEGEPEKTFAFVSELGDAFLQQLVVIEVDPSRGVHEGRLTRGEWDGNIQHRTFNAQP
jgi:hypothetical protein